MKRAIHLTFAVVFLAGLTGCITQHGRRPWACMGGSCAQAPENCVSCNDPGQCSECRGPGFFNPRGRGCDECEGHGCRLCGGRDRAVAEQAPSGPPTGTVAYPYYTTRGPRDFLAKNPPSIGP
jgi:hypothetical protein